MDANDALAAYRERLSRMIWVRMIWDAVDQGRIVDLGRCGRTNPGHVSNSGLSEAVPTLIKRLT